MIRRENNYSETYNCNGEIKRHTYKTQITCALPVNQIRRRCLKILINFIRQELARVHTMGKLHHYLHCYEYIKSNQRLMRTLLSEQKN